MIGYGSSPLCFEAELQIEHLSDLCYCHQVVHPSTAQQGAHVALGMVSLKDLPAEVLEKILGLLSGDPVSVRRAGLVCYQWSDIIQNLLLRGRITCNPKVKLLGESFKVFCTRCRTL